jgi:hypothetical protein
MGIKVVVKDRREKEIASLEILKENGETVDQFKKSMHQLCKLSFKFDRNIFSNNF